MTKEERALYSAIAEKVEYRVRCVRTGMFFAEAVGVENMDGRGESEADAIASCKHYFINTMDYNKRLARSLGRLHQIDTSVINYGTDHKDGESDQDD